MARKVKNTYMVKVADNSIPKNKDERETTIPNGNTQDIINEIWKNYSKNAIQARKFATKIQGPNVTTTLENIWKFTKHNIRYQIDELGVQEIKSPSAVWWERICDCKGYAIFIKSILFNLGIKCHFKYAGYSVDKDVTHVYVIVPLKGYNAKTGVGKYITLDGCMPAFNHEKETIKNLIK